MTSHMTTKSMQHNMTKQVQKGNVRLDKHAGAGYAKSSKKAGSGKWNWGDMLSHLQEELEAFEEEEEEEELVDVVHKPVAVKLEKPVKKKLTAWNSEMLPAMKRARKASTRGRKLRVAHVPSLGKQRTEFGAGFTPAHSMGSKYEEILMTPSTYEEELQMLVQQISGKSSALAADMAKLAQKKMMPKKLNTSSLNNIKPNVYMRKHHFVVQPMAAVRCH